MSKKLCKACKSDRIISVSGHRFQAIYRNTEKIGYVPSNINIGSGD